MTTLLQMNELVTLIYEALDDLDREQADAANALLLPIVEGWQALVDEAGGDKADGLARARQAFLARLAGHGGAQRLALIRIEHVVGHIEMAGLRLRELARRPAAERRLRAREELAKLTAWGDELRGEPAALAAAAQDRLAAVVMQAYAVVRDGD
jgi:hypothetical protein